MAGTEPFDPWSGAGTSETGRSHTPGAVAGAGRLLLSAGLGAVGPAAAVWGHGVDNRRAALLLVGAAVVWATALRRWPMGRASAVVLAAAAIGAAAVAGQRLGKAPPLVGLALTTIAFAALVAWRPTPRWPARPTPTASLALPVLAAAAATWWRSQDLRVTGALALAAILVVEASARFPGAVGPVDRAVARGARAVGHGVGYVITFLVATCCLYLPGAVVAAGARVVRSVRRRPDTAWRVRTASVHDHRTDALRPFATTDRSVRLRRNLVAATIVASCSVLAWALVADGAPSVPEGTASGNPPANALGNQQLLERPDELPAYTGVEYARRMAADQLRFSNSALRPTAVDGVGMADFESETTNVQAGERRTTPPPPCDCRESTAWFVGGSAAFGMGQRDDHTIASDLSRLAAKDGVALTVRNLAVPGWTIWQEYQAVVARLALRQERPDIVIFYDGFNDLAGTLFESTVRDPDPEVPTILDNDQVQAFFAGSAASFGSAERITEMGRLAGRRYEAVRRMIAAQLTALGIRVEFFFQPDALSTPGQQAGIDQLYASRPDFRAALLSLGPAYDAAIAEIDPSVHDLRRLYEDVPEIVMIDTVHTNEPGAALAAAAIAPIVVADEPVAPR